MKTPSQSKILKGLHTLLLGGALFFSKANAADTFIRGDSNSDGKVNIADVVSDLKDIYHGIPVNCPDAADINDDGKVNLEDPVLALNYSFKGGQKPAEPFPEKGYDITKDNLDCNGQGDLEKIIEIRQENMPLTINESGTRSNPIYFLLREEVRSPETAIKVNGNNLIIDGNKQKLIYGEENSRGVYGIHVKNRENVAIKNLEVHSAIFGQGQSADIFLQNVTNAEVIGNTLSNTTELWGKGIQLEGSNNITLERNNIVTYGRFGNGIDIKNSHDSKFKDNKIIAVGESAHGIELNESSKNDFRNIDVNAPGFLARGISVLGNSDGNSFHDSVIDAPSLYDIVFTTDASGTLKIANTQLGRAALVGSDKAKLEVQWYLDAIVKDKNSTLEGAKVEIYNDNKSIALSTNNYGRIPRQELPSFVQTMHEKKNEYPYFIRISKSEYKTLNTQFDLDGNKDLEFKLEK